MTFEFCLPTRATTVTAGPDWLHEVKYGGHRLRLERDDRGTVNSGHFRNERDRPTRQLFSLASRKRVSGAGFCSRTLRLSTVVVVYSVDPKRDSSLAKTQIRQHAGNGKLSKSEAEEIWIQFAVPCRSSAGCWCEVCWRPSHVRNGAFERALHRGRSTLLRTS
jgi:hypothetical protein